MITLNFRHTKSSNTHVHKKAYVYGYPRTPVGHKKCVITAVVNLEGGDSHCLCRPDNAEAGPKNGGVEAEVRLFELTVLLKALGIMWRL